MTLAAVLMIGAIGVSLGVIAWEWIERKYRNLKGQTNVSPE